MVGDSITNPLFGGMKMNKTLNKYWIMTKDEPCLFISFKTEKEVEAFIYSLHEEWNINNVEEETGEEFLEFLYENIGSDEVLIFSSGDCLGCHRFIEFDF